MPSREVVEELRLQNPAGTVVILDKMIDEQTPTIGTAGVVTGVDDIGTIHVDWLTGSTLGVAYPVDEVHIATPYEAALYYINKPKNSTMVHTVHAVVMKCPVIFTLMQCPEEQTLLSAICVV